MAYNRYLWEPADFGSGIIRRKIRRKVDELVKPEENGMDCCQDTV